jgi:hypothetical protein
MFVTEEAFVVSQIRELSGLMNMADDGAKNRHLAPHTPLGWPSSPLVLGWDPVTGFGVEFV